MTKLLFRFTLLVVAGLGPAAALAQKQPPDPVNGHFKYMYAVKFVCGKTDGQVVAPGRYFTAINVHNPNSTSMGFVKKIAVALPEEKAGPVSQFFEAKLNPDEAMEIDCPDILKHAQSQTSFLKGFVVLQSPALLDVVAVYTAAGSTGAVEAMHMERVSAGSH